jgi:hypothetical protein
MNREETALRASVSQQEQHLRRMESSDVIISDDKRLLLRSPNGTYFSLTVDDMGGLSTNGIGTEI